MTHSKLDNGRTVDLLGRVTESVGDLPMMVDLGGKTEVCALSASPAASSAEKKNSQESIINRHVIVVQHQQLLSPICCDIDRAQNINEELRTVCIVCTTKTTDKQTVE